MKIIITNKDVSSIAGKIKLSEIDAVRAIAILAVVVIHATSEGTARMPQGGAQQKAYVALNTVSHFSVPVFVFLSGVVLAYRYFDRWSLTETAVFYRKRVVSAVLPYLLWSAFYFYWNAWLNDLLPGTPDAAAIGRMLLHGTAFYHLYFLVLIVQYYLVFPLVMSALRKLPSLIDWLVPFGVALQAAYYAWCSRYAPDAYASEAGLTYVSHFLLGCWVGIRYDKLAPLAGRLAAVLTPLALIAAAAHVGLSLQRLHSPHALPAAAYVAVVNVYAMLASLALTALGRVAVQRIPTLVRSVLALGAASFGVYLLHPALLSAYRQWVVPPDTDAAYHLYALGGFAVSLGGAWLLAALYAKTRGRFR